MKLEDSSIATLAGIVLCPDFGADRHLLASEIDRLLSAGNETHPEEQRLEEHLEHAIRHLRLGLDNRDADSGFRHRAHAASRLLLALRELSRTDTGAVDEELLRKTLTFRSMKSPVGNGNGGDRC